MVTKYGEFPGVKVTTAGGGITAVAIGEEEKLVLFGEANYENDESFLSDGEADPLVDDGTAEEPAQIGARREADTTFGDGSELADAMREALANGANIDFLYGVAPKRFNVINETQANQTGSLTNAPIWEEDVSDESNISALHVDDVDGTGEVTTGTVDIDIRYTYENPPSGPITTPTDDTGDVDVVVVNPLTGQYAADQSPTDHFEFRYKYLDWQSAIEAKAVENVVDEDETAIWNALTESDGVSSTLSGQLDTLRTEEYKLINGMSGALPNDYEEITDSSGNYVRRDARFDPSTFSKGSVNKDYYFKLAPVRLENTTKTILGGVSGLFAGNPLNDPIYNDPVSGYDGLEQSFTKQDADNMRDQDVIPIRESGSVRVKDNRSTSDATDWERDFWRRRIADRVILIAKTVGDTIIGRINDPQTRDAAARLIRAEIRELINDRLLRPNTDDEQRWFVDVYEDSTDPDEVNVDIGFTPYGIVKRVDANITINT